MNWKLNSRMLSRMGVRKWPRTSSVLTQSLALQSGHRRFVALVAETLRIVWIQVGVWNLDHEFLLFLCLGCNPQEVKKIDG